MAFGSFLDKTKEKAQNAANSAKEKAQNTMECK